MIGHGGYELDGMNCAEPALFIRHWSLVTPAGPVEPVDGPAVADHGGVTRMSVQP